MQEFSLRIEESILKYETIRKWKQLIFSIYHLEVDSRVVSLLFRLKEKNSNTQDNFGIRSKKRLLLVSNFRWTWKVKTLRPTKTIDHKIQNTLIIMKMF